VLATPKDASGLLPTRGSDRQGRVRACQSACL